MRSSGLRELSFSIEQFLYTVPPTASLPVEGAGEGRETERGTQNREQGELRPVLSQGCLQHSYQSVGSHAGHVIHPHTIKVSFYCLYPGSLGPLLFVLKQHTSPHYVRRISPSTGVPPTICFKGQRSHMTLIRELGNELLLGSQQSEILLLVLNYYCSCQYYVRRIPTVRNPPVGPELPLQLPVLCPEDPDSPGSSC